MKNEDCNSILAIHSLDQLKDKIAKVIIMVLVVNFFKEFYIQNMKHHLSYYILH
jgi:uncharacterized membrane protein YqhA